MNFNKNIPVYLQIMDMIINKIITGKFKPGEKILSIRDFASEYTINQNTVLKSYKELETLNIIEMKLGIGYFVTSDKSLIEKIKENKSKQIVNDFVDDMKNMGLTNTDILKLIKEIINVKN